MVMDSTRIMSLYPSLEDMKVDQLYKEQIKYETQAQFHNTLYPAVSANQSANSAALPYTLSPSVLYPSLNDYMGLELSPQMIAANMPEYSSMVVAQTTKEIISSNNVSGTKMVAPLSGQSLGLQRAQVTHGIRELTLCKDAAGKTGLRVSAINKGIFVCLVVKGSPAAMAGLRFGDQILQINGTVVAGFTMNQVHDLFKKSPINGISVIVRDRPFERTITLHKDSVGHIGFHFKNGQIMTIVKDSSAARNGLLIEHNLLEVDGQNVIGIKDKEITSIIEKAGPIVTITVIPTFVYTHIIQKMASNLVKASMDHSTPSL
uniref:PDZ domain-containing protein n=2 Tax=Clastoptera arizonana TaxID=38151 RepID=A0A1B6CEC6_9HEMI